MKERYIKLLLPLPISINKAFCNAKKWRVKSDEYKNWEKLAYYELLKQPRFKIIWDKWLEVFYTYYMPIYTKNKKIKKIDVFNYEKVLSDFLEHNIEWFRDEKIKIWHISKHDSNRNEVEIYIKEV